MLSNFIQRYAIEQCHSSVLNDSNAQYAISVFYFHPLFAFNLTLLELSRDNSAYDTDVFCKKILTGGADISI